jgi:hypothetical protein
MTIAELLVASAIMAATMGAAFTLVAQSQAAFRVQPEVADMHQRARAAIDAMTRDIMAAAVVLPRRAGRRDPDPADVAFDDRITLVFNDATGAITGSRTYYLQDEPASGLSRLMQYDGDRSDLPLVDGVVALRFEYVENVTVRLVNVMLRLRRESAAVRGNSEQWEIRFAVAPRNTGR